MRLMLFLICSVLALSAGAQTVTGSWYGLAEADLKAHSGNNYLTELLITQKGNEVEGVFGYYFRSGYQSYYVRGTYNPKTRRLVIKNIPVTYFKSLDIDGIDCPMDFTATLFTSKVESKLSGAFETQEKYKYTCPPLKFSYVLDVNDKSQDSISRRSANIRKYWKPRNEELVVNTKDLSPTGNDKPAETKKPVNTDTAVAKSDLPAPAVDTAALAKRAADSARRRELEQLRTAFSQRKTILSKEVLIESDSVRIGFYDNGDIDGDSISVFINKVPVLTHQPLTERALNMYLAMDSAHTVTEISMYAENLGKYPPNTALMIITDGEKQHEVFMSSSLTQNSSVILRRKAK